MFFVFSKNCSLGDLSNRAFYIAYSASAQSIKDSFPVRAYLSFCSNYNLDPIQANRDKLYEQLYQYISYRINFLGGTYGTARSDITTIEKYLALHKIHSEVKLWKPMGQFLKSLKESFPVKSNKKRPFRESELALAFAKLKPNSWDTLIVRCLIAFGLGGALRASEFTAPNKKPTKSQAVNLVKKNRIFRFDDEKGHPSMLYYFFRSKTNHSWKPEFAVMPCVCDVPLPCAYHELLRLESHIKRAHGGTYLFVWSDGSLVTYSDTLFALKRVAKLVGSDADTIGTHSLRKARIVIGVKRGLPAQALLQIGRWATFDSIIPYLQMGPFDLNQSMVANFSRAKL